MMTNLWRDEAGAVLTTEALLLSTILGLGLVVGLTAWRDALARRLQGVATRIDEIGQPPPVVRDPAAGLMLPPGLAVRCLIVCDSPQP